MLETSLDWTTALNPSAVSEPGKNLEHKVGVVQEETQNEKRSLSVFLQLLPALSGINFLKRSKSPAQCLAALEVVKAREPFHWAPVGQVRGVCWSFVMWVNAFHPWQWKGRAASRLISWACDGDQDLGSWRYFNSSLLPFKIWSLGGHKTKTQVRSSIKTHP